MASSSSSCRSKSHGLLTEKHPLPVGRHPTVSTLNRVVPAHSATRSTCKHWSKLHFVTVQIPLPTIQSVRKQFKKLKMISTKCTQDLKYLPGCRGSRPCLVRNVHGSDLPPGHRWAPEPQQWGRGGPGDQGRKVCPEEVQVQGRKGGPSTHQPIKHQTALSRSVPFRSF